MYHPLRWSLVGHIELEAHLRPLSLAGQFRIGANAAEPLESQNRLQTVALLIGAVLALPAALALTFGALRFILGFAALYDAAFASSTFVTLATASLFLGTPLAFLLTLFVIVRVRLTRQDSRLLTSLTLEPTFWHLVVLAFAFAISALFFGHLVADGLACFRGIKSTC